MRILDRIYLRLAEELERRPRRSHYPSQPCVMATEDTPFVGTCVRAQWYDWKSIERSNPMTPQTLLKLRIGNSAHEAVAHLLDTGDAIKEVEIKRTFAGLEHPVSGRVDNLIYDGDNYTALEVKSVWGGGVRAIEMGGPRQNDALQLMTYLFLGAADIGKLLYVSDTNKHFEFTVVGPNVRTGRYQIEETQADLPHPDMLLHGWSKVEESLKQPDAPARCYKAYLHRDEPRLTNAKTVDKVEYKSDWQCLYCGWSNLCWRPVIEKVEEEPI